MASEKSETDEALEWHWPHSLNTPLVTVSGEARVVSFHRHFSRGTAGVRGDTPLLRNHHYYWELLVCNLLYGTDTMVGVTTATMDLNSSLGKFTSLLGRESDSWGFSYTGQIQHGGRTVKYGSKYGMGDVLGLHLDMWRGTLTFYINGLTQGVAFRGLRAHPCLYPAVCSTAARTSLKLLRTASLPASLQLQSARALPRVALPSLRTIPGLQCFNTNPIFSFRCDPDDLYYESDDDLEQLFIDGKIRSYFIKNSVPRELSEQPRAARLHPPSPASLSDSSPEDSPALSPNNLPDVNEVYAGLAEPALPAPLASPALPAPRLRPLNCCDICQLKCNIVIKDEENKLDRCLPCFLRWKDEN